MNVHAPRRLAKHPVAWQERGMTGPSEDEPIETIRALIAFLRKATADMRRIADSSPEIAQELRHIANQCERETEDLSNHFGIGA